MRSAPRSEPACGSVRFIVPVHSPRDELLEVERLQIASVPCACKRLDRAHRQQRAEAERHGGRVPHLDAGRIDEHRQPCPPIRQRARRARSSRPPPRPYRSPSKPGGMVTAPSFNGWPAGLSPTRFSGAMTRSRTCRPPRGSPRRDRPTDRRRDRPRSAVEPGHMAHRESDVGDGRAIGHDSPPDAVDRPCVAVMPYSPACTGTAITNIGQLHTGHRAMKCGAWTASFGARSAALPAIATRLRRHRPRRRRRFAPGRARRLPDGDRLRARRRRDQSGAPSPASTRPRSGPRFNPLIAHVADARGRAREGAVSSGGARLAARLLAGAADPGRARRRRRARSATSRGPGSTASPCACPRTRSRMRCIAARRPAGRGALRQSLGPRQPDHAPPMSWPISPAASTPSSTAARPGRARIDHRRLPWRRAAPAAPRRPAARGHRAVLGRPLAEAWARHALGAPPRRPLAPGMLASHYAPRATVRLDAAGHPRRRGGAAVRRAQRPPASPGPRAAQSTSARRAAWPRPPPTSSRIARLDAIGRRDASPSCPSRKRDSGRRSTTGSAAPPRLAERPRCPRAIWASRVSRPEPGDAASRLADARPWRSAGQLAGNGSHVLALEARG